MPFLTINPFHRKARTTQNKNISAWFIALSAIFSASIFADPLTPYRAEYEVSRNGSIQGTALRELTKNADNTYILTYQSDIEWMIFSDERNERSKFKIENNQAIPLEYSMSRKGTGPDKQYNLIFDQTKQQIIASKKKQPLKVEWKSEQKDLLTYQFQLRQDLKAGKTSFSYPIIDKNGSQRNYDFEIDGKETITLPIGNVETIRVKRLYDNDKRQATAWFAPEYDYLLVKMYKGKEGIEQFQVQLKQYNK